MFLQGLAPTTLLGSRLGAATLARSDSGFSCLPLTAAVERLREAGARIAYSDALLSPEMLVTEEPSSQALATGDFHKVLHQFVAAYGLTVETASRGTLSIVPAAGAGSAENRHRGGAGPLLQRLDSYEAIPRWVESPSPDSRFVELTLPREDEFPPHLGSRTELILLRVPETAAGMTSALRFELKQLIVEARALAPRARFGLELSGLPRLAAKIVDSELAPYIDGYAVSSRDELPAADPTASLWWRARHHTTPMLETLLEGANRGADLVILEGSPAPGHRSAAKKNREAEETLFLQALRSSGGVLLDNQPPIESSPGIWSRAFLEPRSNRYLIAAYTPEGAPSRLSLAVEPILETRILFPPTAGARVETNGRQVEVSFDGSSPNWLIELVPEATSSRSGGTRVEGEVIIDPYEVVVLNQIFQKRQRSKVSSLDVMETLTIIPSWQGGIRSDWEHRVFHRRGQLDEYLHLGVLRNGIAVPRDKLHRIELWRPIERVELLPLQLENRKVYRYTYRGEQVIDGHLTWRIHFEPVVAGRFVSGTAWIDQETGAHRRIQTEHPNFGGGLLRGEYTTDYEWISDNGRCYWDWRSRRGSELADFLDYTGTFGVEYRRERFRYNRPEIGEEIRRAHESDVLIHVATPPHGHRWLLRGVKPRPRRGDQRYPEHGCARPELGPDECADDPRPASTVRDAAESPLELVLAGAHAFPTASRLTVGWVGGTDDVETRVYPSFNYVNRDFLGRGRRSGNPLYLRLLGSEEDALFTLTDPAIGDTPWSWTAGVEVELDPEQDLLFQRSADSSLRDVTLDVHRSSLRLSLVRPLGHHLVGRLRYGLRDLEVKRRADTDPEFVLPPSTLEHSLNWELEFSRQPWVLELGVEGGLRERWQSWGLLAAEEARGHFGRFRARISTAHSLGRSQTLGVTLRLFDGWNLDRFSRPRLYQVDARVAGHNSGLAFDAATHTSLGYNFRLGRLPFQLRLDGARLREKRGAGAPDLVQTLVGSSLSLNLDGPLATDWSIGMSRGLHADPSRRTPTYWWVFVSRRFGP